MTDYFTKRPMLSCAIIGAILCIIGFYSKAAVYFSGIFFIAAFFLLLYKRAQFKYLAVVLLLFITAVRITDTVNTIKQVSGCAGISQSGSFIVLDEPETRDGYSIVSVETDNCKPLPKGTKLTVFYEDNSLKCGDYFSCKVNLHGIDDKYKKMNYSNGVYLSGNISEITVDGNKSDFILSGIAKIRKYIRSTLFSNIAKKEASTLVALVTGDRSYLSDEFYLHIKCAGVSHIMVVSGLHLAVIVSLMMTLSELLIYNRFIRAFVIFVTVLFMMTLCGFTMSIIRAGFSYLIFAFSVVLGRKNTPENTLGTAVILMLIISPFTVFNISFQLSVLATLGIVTAALPLIKHAEDWELFKNPLLFSVVSAALISVSALLFTLPVVIAVFGYIAVFSVIANLLISFAVTAALTLAALGLAVNLVCPLAAAPVFFVSEIFTKYINYVIDTIGGLEFAAVDTGNLAFPVSLVVLAIVIICLFACKKANYMLRLKQIQRKMIDEGGGKLKWQ